MLPAKRDDYRGLLLAVTVILLVSAAPSWFDPTVTIGDIVTFATVLGAVALWVLRAWAIPRLRQSRRYRWSRFERAQFDPSRSPDEVPDLTHLPIGTYSFVIELRPRREIQINDIAVRFVLNKSDKEGEPEAPGHVIKIVGIEAIADEGFKPLELTPAPDRTGCGYVGHMATLPTTLPGDTSTLVRVKVRVMQQWEGGYLGIRCRIPNSKPYHVFLPARTDPATLRLYDEPAPAITPGDRDQLRLALQAPKSWSSSWEPFGIHKIFVVRFQELVLTNQTAEAMSIELALLPLGAGVVHTYDQRFAVAPQKEVIARDVLFKCLFWIAGQDKPEVGLDNMVMIAKDHISAQKRNYGVLNLVMGATGW